MDAEVDCDDHVVKLTLSYPCPERECNRVYYNQRTLKEHLKKVHSHNDVVTQGRFLCKACGRSFYHATKLVEHSKKDHGSSNGFQLKTFPSWIAFTAWKEEEEQSTYSCFVRPTGEVVSEEINDGSTRTVMFVCCRDGSKRGHSGTTKTGKTRKSKHSRKLEDYCTARMTATEYHVDGRVEVRYYSHHTNHQPDVRECRNLPLPTSVKEDIQQQFAAGITIEQIMDNIRGTLGSRNKRCAFLEEATRKQFITRQDCRNICQKYRNFTQHRHTEDAVSVHRIVQELSLESPSPVLLYKPQGIEDPELPALTKDMFLLVIMTEFQATLFETFSGKIACIDSTHKTNQYRFKLLTIIVPDEYHNGQPVAWAMSDKEDSDTLQAVWSAVHKRCPSATVSTIMTDDDSAGAIACARVYPDVQQLLCRWHVDRAWQRKLYSEVKNDENRAQMYACLSLLISEQDVATFLKNQEMFTTYWRAREPEFIKYYEKEYSNRAEKWALCYRHFDHADIDTNMLVESFHNKLKTNPRYLNHHVNRRCDDLIEVLLKIEEDTFYDRMRKEVMMRPQDASLKQEGCDRHYRGKDINDSAVIVIDDNSYQVDSTNKETRYNVFVLTNICSERPNCVPQCSQVECEYLCRHMIKCTCMDYIHGHLCKHVHKVNILYKAQAGENFSTMEEIDVEHDDAEVLSDITNDILCDENDDISADDTDISIKKTADVLGRRKAINKYLEKIKFSVDSIDDANTLDRILALIMKANASTTISNSNCPYKFEKKDHFAPRQKNEIQLRFTKTSENPGRKQKNIPLSQPTKQVKEAIWEAMKKDDPIQLNDDKAQQPTKATVKDVKTANRKGSTNSSSVRKRQRCGMCDGCQMQDCGKCSHCRDMIKFGGPGRKKQACILRKCTNKGIKEVEKQVSSSQCQDITNNLEVASDILVDLTESEGQNQPQDMEPQDMQTLKSSVAVTSNKQPDAEVWINSAQYLFKFKRGVEAIRGDGNCLFRALSRILCGNEDNHSFIRRTLVTFATQNKTWLQKFCHPVPIENHLNGMKLDRIWGTDLEIHAAASLWQVPIYVCTQNPNDPKYFWVLFKPINSSKLVLPDECQQLPLPPGVHHFELLHAWRCHYDVIIGPDGYLPDYPPPMPDIQDIYVTL